MCRCYGIVQKVAAHDGGGGVGIGLRIYLIDFLRQLVQDGLESPFVVDRAARLAVMVLDLISGYSLSVPTANFLAAFGCFVPRLTAVVAFEAFLTKKWPGVVIVIIRVRFLWGVR